MEQGVPVTDCDLNEYGELEKFHTGRIIRDFIGSGPPTGSTGFQIGGANSYANDFDIGPGILYLADSPNGGTSPIDNQGNYIGWCLICEGYQYSTQPNPSVYGLQTGFPLLTTPGGARTDTVWLECYEQDYGPLDDTYLYFNNPLTSSNTDVSHRIKILTNTRVWEGSGAYSSGLDISTAPFYNSVYTYYPLATIVRTATATINAGMITDVRTRIPHAF